VTALARVAARLIPDPDGISAWRRRIIWLERLAPASEFDQERRLGEKWAPLVPAALRGRLAAARAGVETDVEAAFADAFQNLAGKDPARAAGSGLGVPTGGMPEEGRQRWPGSTNPALGGASDG
jgi:hypothetical protein